MRTYALPLTVLLSLCPSAARAEVHLGISIGLPVAPQMELVAPGIQVVAGFQEEVFLQGGWYWCRRPDGWYRSRDGRGNYDFVDYRRVPRGLSRMPAGQYRNWHREGMRGHGNEGRGHENEGRGHDVRGHGNDRGPGRRDEHGHEGRGHDQGGDEHGHR